VGQSDVTVDEGFRMLSERCAKLHHQVAGAGPVDPRGAPVARITCWADTGRRSGSRLVAAGAALPPWGGAGALDRARLPLDFCARSPEELIPRISRGAQHCCQRGDFGGSTDVAPLGPARWRRRAFPDP
jgi:hypothetical protein